MFTVTTGWFVGGRGQVMLTLQVTQFKYSSPGCFEQAAAETGHHSCPCNELYSPGQLSRDVRQPKLSSLSDYEIVARLIYVDFQEWYDGSINYHLSILYHSAKGITTAHKDDRSLTARISNHP
jgi:hypothetical protein